MNVRSEITVKKLAGHSGCDVRILQSALGLFVRKTSRDAIYNTRLQLQCEKQQNYQSLKLVKTPRVLRAGDANGLFFFDMEYVHGQSLAHYIDNLTTPMLQSIVPKVLGLLRDDCVAIDAGVQQRFRQKLNQLSEQVPNDPVIAIAFARLRAFDWSNYPSGPCHGDLTFENILISKTGELVLIDFLDSFHDSWVIDLAKLFQDLELQWSYRHQARNATRDIRLAVLRENMLTALMQRTSGPRVVEAVYHTLLLNILRIIPYANQTTRAFLAHGLSEVMMRMESQKFT